ncbi:DUF134 domain-containing protein [Methanogenium organophilum]|uniref:UPF0251 protein OU421_02135 n=1 Tax=Methanogenium organophilum TaxID=2199 RepID=A0A9X9T911_METOG|nr:DUF134 domain-containing protein [Methanogenium organophilum]WAI01692.1 DUF134 domain-containing protein [Methanogenium organophilum]
MNYGAGKGNRRRGRPRRARMIENEGLWRCYAPCCGRDERTREVVSLLPEELEAFRLVDSEGLDQESAAERMNVSRRTLWRDVHTARRKVADALSEGKVIVISDCGQNDQETCHLLDTQDETLPQPEE